MSQNKNDKKSIGSYRNFSEDGKTFPREKIWKHSFNKKTWFWYLYGVVLITWKYPFCQQTGQTWQTDHVCFQSVMINAFFQMTMRPIFLLVCERPWGQLSIRNEYQSHYIMSVWDLALCSQAAVANSCCLQVFMSTFILKKTGLARRYGHAALWWNMTAWPTGDRLGIGRKFSYVTSVVPNQGCKTSFQGVREESVFMTGNWYIYYFPAAFLFSFAMDCS